VNLPRRIFKYPLPQGVMDMTIPAGATVLHIGLQGEVPTVWAAVPVVPQGNPLRIHVAVTGDDEPPPNFAHAGTVVGVDGWAVFHVYVEKES
jgi:hypothetical protein